MVFAPLLGARGVEAGARTAFTFKLRLFAGAGDITTAYEAIARRLYGFRDYRQNAIASLNETLDNMIDYGMSRYSWFVDELKGCAYSTDVPGAVKNVSSLTPLNIALVADDEEIFQPGRIRLSNISCRGRSSCSRSIRNRRSRVRRAR